ncbi:MMPL family transporter [Saccharopolyspora sp. 6T]|nr:efflux RND transporter permease subunit [Saccharopolyspora sp. 6T]MCA1185273.1 MMPL family transporter [Saccharopolyspora sp. 6T]
MSSFLYTLGRRAYAARKTVLVIWLLVLVVTGGAAGLLFKGMDNNVTIPGTEAQNALDRLSVTFPQTSGASAQIIVVADDVRAPAVQREVERSVDELEGMDEAASIVSPYNADLGGSISEDGEAALIMIQLEGQTMEIGQPTKDHIAQISADLQQRLPEGSQSSYGGPLFAQSFPGISIVEALGLVIAIVVLMITLGSFLAAGMPLVNALIGVGVSTALILVSTAFGSVTATTPLLSLMLGLAVGIDYALFIVSRHQQELAQGVSPQEAAARSTATAGSAVIFAGLTVVIALVGLGVAGIPFLTTMGVAGAVAVAIAVLVSLTLIPALLGFAGARLTPRGGGGGAGAGAGPPPPGGGGRGGGRGGGAAAPGPRGAPRGPPPPAAPPPAPGGGPPGGGPPPAGGGAGPPRGPPPPPPPSRRWASGSSPAGSAPRPASRSSPCSSSSASSASRPCPPPGSASGSPTRARCRTATRRGSPTTSPTSTSRRASTGR